MLLKLLMDSKRKKIIIHIQEKKSWLKKRKRKYYKITKKGLKVLEDTKAEWNAYSAAVRKVIDAIPVKA